MRCCSPWAREWCSPARRRARSCLRRRSSSSARSSARGRAPPLVFPPPPVIVGAMVGAGAFLRLIPAGPAGFAPGIPAAIALRGLVTFAFFGTDAYVSLTLTSLRGASVTLAGIALTAATISWTTGAWIQARGVARNGPRTMVRIGTLVIALGTAGMILTARVSVPIVVAVIAWALGGLGMGLAYAPLSLIVLGEAPVGGEGGATASLQLCDTLGVALGTGASGAIVAAGAALHWSGASALSIAFAVSTAVALIASVAAVRLPRSLATRPSSSP